MKIVTKEQLDKYLYDYYRQNYGENENDIWYDQPAVNVWLFERDGKFITLKSHILTGNVTEYIESKGV